MKILDRKIFTFLIPVILLGLMTVTSCEDNEGGEPVIHYVRVTNPESSDSLLVGAFLGDLVAIMGENLGGTREIWFNDLEAVIIPTYVTNTSILVNLPSRAPSEVTNDIRLVFANGSVLTHEFVVEISEPLPVAMISEYAPVGSTTVITGDFFFEPMSVTFSGGAEAVVEVVDQNTLEVTIPEGAASGPLTIQTNFGTTETSFHYRDQRNIFLNYDDLNADGSWRPGLYVTDDHSLDGNYLKLSGTYSADAPREEGPLGDNHYESQFWGQGNGRPEGSLIPGEPENYALKFEAKIITWNASYLNICFAPWNNGGNNEIWSNDLNPRAVWGPWESAGGAVDSGGEWVTVTIPITEFKYDMSTNASGDVVYTESANKFNMDNTGSLSFWMLGAPSADNSPFEIYIDNVRIVEL
ncbi:glycan-binding surface protein [Marinoscillum sp.]|uniref:glycan-binding surface protein n=1 Tax=Marinoscillum sp. TaxID=2024838 RepID=UPI003BA9F647